MTLIDQINALSPDERHTALIALAGMVVLREAKGHPNDALLLATALDAALQFAASPPVISWSGLRPVVDIEQDQFRRRPAPLNT